MRARRAASFAATAALLITLAACGSDDPESDGETAAEPTATETASVSESADAGTDDTEATSTQDQDELSSEQEGTQSEDAATQEQSSDAQEPGGDDAQWISPGSSDRGDGDLAGGPLLAVDVRTGVHDYYDRVVVDLEGEGGNPGWFAEYTGTPFEDGSGFPIEIEGNAFLHVTVSGFRYPEPDEDFAQGLTRVDGSGVTEAYVGAPFEGQIQVVLGVDSARPYRVFVLPDPLRLVVDIEIAG